MSTDATSHRASPPLGLPKGSVRALLTLLIVAVVCRELYAEKELGVLWSETLMIALAHYFTSRRFIDLPQDVLERLERDGHLPQESNPLYLPRNSIRLIIAAAFAGLGILLYRTFDTIPYSAWTILGVVFAYAVGLLTGGIWKRLFRRKPNVKLNRWWNNIKAGVVLAALLITAMAYLLGLRDLVPEQFEQFAAQFEKVTLGLVLFYFGSR